MAGSIIPQDVNSTFLTLVPSDAMVPVAGGSSGASFGIMPTADMIWTGAQFDRMRMPSVYKTVSATVITSETTIWTPASGKKFRLMGFMISQGVATGAITLKDNTAGTTIFVIPQQTVGVAILCSLGNGILSAAANNVLTATGASTETITGTFWGTEE